MPSTYTGSGIELIADGEQSGTWGQTTNDNLQLITRLTSEAGVISLSGTTHTLTIADGSLSDGQYGVLVFGGAPSGTNTVTVSPNDAKRIYLVKNTTSESVIMTQGSGGDVTIPAGAFKIVYTDGQGAGAEVVDVATNISAVTGTFSGNLTVDTDTLFVDAANNRVGVGTASPSQNLHVEASEPSDDLVYFNNTNGTASDVLRLNTAGVGSGTIIFDAQSGGTTRFMVQGDGNVGIGTTSPRGILDINDSDPQTVYIADLTDGVTLGHSAADSFVTLGSVSTGAVGLLNYNRTVGAFTYSEGAVGSEVEYLRIDSSGNVGIGTSSPSSILHTSGTDHITIQDTNNTSTNIQQHVSLQRGDGSGIDGRINTVGDGSNGVSAIAFAINGERLRIDSSGNVGIGTNNPTRPLHVIGNGRFEASGTTFVSVAMSNTNGTTDEKNVDWLNNSTNFSLRLLNDASSAGRTAYNVIRDGYTPTTHQWYTAASGTPSERMRIDSSGNVGIGTSSPGFSLDVQADGGAGPVTSRILNTGTDVADDAILRLSIGGTTAESQIYFGDNTSVSIGRISYDHSNDRMEFWTNNNQRVTILSGGNVGIGTTSPAHDLHVAAAGRFDGVLYAYNEIRANDSGNVPASNSNSASTAGVRLQPDGNSHVFSAVSDQVLLINRITNDGALITFYGQGTAEGSISVSGTTITYGGGHLARWSRLPSEKRADIPKGTVLTNLDAMVVWQKEDGTIEANEQLNQTEISSVEGDPNVAGVFDHWDNDDDEGYNSDFYVAMTGDFIIRIGAGVTVQRGDLLMSAGDGTAKPQSDDIIRSKTIAKVTSTHVTCTYEDGSYCVPCVLMAC